MNDTTPDDIKTPEPKKRRSFFSRLNGLVFTFAVLVGLWVTLRYVLTPLYIDTPEENTAKQQIGQSSPSHEGRIVRLEKELAGMKDVVANVNADKIAALDKRIVIVEDMLKSANAPHTESTTDSSPKTIIDTRPNLSPLLIAEVEGLKAQVAELKKANDTYVRSVIVVGQIQDALRDGNPFAQELQTLHDLRPELAEELKPLAEYASLGVPTYGYLQTEFKQAVARTLAASDTDGSFTDNLRSLVTIRKVGETHMGNDDESIIARAESLLDKGDVLAALNAINNLSGERGKIFATWQEHANAHLQAQTALEKLNQMLSKALAP